MNEDSELNEYLRDEIQRLKDASLQLCERAEGQKKYINELENRLRDLWDKYDGERKHYMERIKRLEEESESRWDLAESAIASCDEMASRIKRLEEAGDAVAAIIGPPGSALWADENEVDAAWNNWTKAKEDKQ